MQIVLFGALGRGRIMRYAIGPMRLSLLLGTALVLTTVPAAARNPFTGDGQFTICPFRDFDHCDLLTEPMMQTDRFSDEEKGTLRTLKTFADAPRSATPARFGQTFGVPDNVFRIPGRTPEEVSIGAAWLTDPKGPCPICGIQAVFQPTGLESFNYSVSNRFMIFWFVKSEARSPR